MPAAPRILFVCLGNICRSPTAEAVMRAKLAAAGIAGEVDSAGTGDWHRGRPPHPPMVRAAAGKGYDLSPLRARQITVADFDRFDLILTADPEVQHSVETLRPANSTTRVALLAPLAGTGLQEVPDPYFTGDFDAAADLIIAACEGLLAQLQ